MDLLENIINYLNLKDILYILGIGVSLVLYVKTYQRQNKADKNKLYEKYMEVMVGIIVDYKNSTKTKEKLYCLFESINEESVNVKRLESFEPKFGKEIADKIDGILELIFQYTQLNNEVFEIETLNHPKVSYEQIENEILKLIDEIIYSARDKFNAY